MAIGLIVGLHALALGVGLLMKGPLADRPAEAEPIHVQLLAQPVAEPVQPHIKVALEAPALPAPVMPLVSITLPDEPPAAITVAAQPAPAQPAAPRSAGADAPVSVSDPDYLELPRPVYPLAAKRARAQGVVHVRALVDEEGHARDTAVARSSGFDLLDRAACDAVRRAVFKPYLVNNVARAMVVVVPVEFSLMPHGIDRRQAAR